MNSTGSGLMTTHHYPRCNETPFNCDWNILPVFLCWGKNNKRIRINLTRKVGSGNSSVADLGCLSRILIFSIPDPNFFCLGSAPKNLSILTQKLFLSSRKYDPGCSSRIRIIIFSPSRIPRSKRHRIPDPNPQHCGYFVKSAYASWCFPRPPPAWMAGPPEPVLRPANLNTRFLRSGSASSCERDQPVQLGKQIRSAMLYLQYYDGQK